MKKCKNTMAIVLFLVASSCIFVNESFGSSENSPVNKDLRVKIIKADLWQNGLIDLRDSQEEQNLEDSGTLYLPEELELALKLISS